MTICLKKHSGFTLVELIVIISVIAILATLSVVMAGNWRASTAETEVKSDLKSVASAMESARNFSNGYPAGIPPTFTASANVTVTYSSGSAADYCINAVSKTVAAVQYFVNTASPSGKEPQAGTC